MRSASMPKAACLVASLLATTLFIAECQNPGAGKSSGQMLQQQSAPSRDGRTLSSSQLSRWAAAAVTQVLAFNVSNFVAVLFIKALLVALGFATGFSGLGLYAGRRADTQEFTYEFPVPPSVNHAQQEEPGHLRWLTTYLATLNTGDHRCLKRLACEQPQRARFYAGLKEMLVGALGMAPLCRGRCKPLSSAPRSRNRKPPTPCFSLMVTMAPSVPCREKSHDSKCAEDVLSQPRSRQNNSISAISGTGRN